MGKLVVTQAHGFTPESLRVEERKMQDVLFKQRLMAVRLVMEGYSATCSAAEKCNAATFLDFLQQLLTQYTDKFVIFILDNARIHHAKLVRPFLEQNRHRLFLLFLPPYSPELNPIEKVWRWLKDMVIVNRFHRNESGVQTVRTLAQFYIDYRRKIEHVFCCLKNNFSLEQPRWYSKNRYDFHCQLCVLIDKIGFLC
ncbi:transposase [Aneurinibacillus thermoaerophilus]|nr:transposase [Aneurinibacillus thermoaerophilus]